MNKPMLKMLLSMVGPDQINSILESFNSYLIAYKQTFFLEENEDEIILILFEKSEKLYISAAAINAENTITRQIETRPLNDILQNLLKIN